MSPAPAAPSHGPVSRTTRRTAALAGVIAALATACASPPGQESKPARLTRVNVAVVNIADAASFMLAEKDGFFRQQGLDVHYTLTAQSAAAMPDLLSGRIDVIGAANYVTAFEAQVHGAADLRILAANGECNPDSDGVLVLEGSGINTPAGLIGKTIAINITGNIQQLLIDRQLQADDLNPAKVHFVEIAFPDMLAALKAHRVDAINEIQPYETEAEENLGAESILSPCTGSTNGMPLTGDISTAQWVNSHHAIALAFQRAIEQGQAVAQTNRTAVEQILPTFLKISKATAATVNLNTFPTSLNSIHLQRVADLMLLGGVISKPLDVPPLLVR
jgi:NitT/TauT family transport system substrate-binding protein